MPSCAMMAQKPLGSVSPPLSAAHCTLVSRGAPPPPRVDVTVPWGAELQASNVTPQTNEWNARIFPPHRTLDPMCARAYALCGRGGASHRSRNILPDAPSPPDDYPGEEQFATTRADRGSARGTGEEVDEVPHVRNPCSARAARGPARAQ